MTYKIAICDDEPADIRHLSALVADWAAATGYIANVDAFPSAEAFLFRYAEDKTCEILLLDIEMGGMSGVELAKRVRAGNDGVQIVFITGYPDFIAEGYEVSALHYLMKPIGRDRLFSVLDRAARNLGKAERSVILAANGEARRIPTDAIMSVEAFAHACAVATASEVIEVKMSISEIEDMLGEGFVRCHRSYIIGIRHIRSISKAEITLDNGNRMPLSRGKYDAVNRAFIRFFKGE